MRRRRNPFATQSHFGGQTAPPPVAFVAPTLNVQGLQTAYDWIVLDKHAGFKLALEWYANSLSTLLFRDPLDETRQKTYDRASKAKANGDSTTYEGEKFQSWSTAIHLFEKIWASKNLPKLDAALEATTPSPAVANIQTVLKNLNAVFTPHVTFRATFGTIREYLSGEILIPYTDLDKFVAEQPLRVALNEVPTVAKVVSLVTDAEGNTSLDGSKFMANLALLLEQVGVWASKEAFKPIGKSAFVTPVAHNTRRKGNGATAPSKTANTRVTLAAPVTDPFGVFKSSNIKAALAALLWDRQWHTIAEMEDICTKNGVSSKWNIPDTFYFLRKKGIKIERQGGSARVL